MRTTLWPVVFAVAACSPSKENKEICRKAGDRYMACVGEMMGPEMQKLAARGGDGTNACARDDNTVAMYKHCMPSATCDQFMDCIIDYAEGHAPTIAADKPRDEQCKEHVEQGMRAIANQIMMSDQYKERTPDERASAQECLFDESRSWKKCISAPEVAEATRYGEKRYADCQKWEPALAACIMRLPSAKDCDHDAEPLWDLPIELGAPGPELAWAATVPDNEGDDKVRIAWAPNKTLIVHEPGKLRALRGDQVVWERDITEVDDELVIAGGFIVLGDESEALGLRVLDAATGADHGRALAGIALEHHGAIGDKVLVQTDPDELWEVTAAKCKGAKPTKACATRLGQLDTDDTVYSDHLTGWRDRIVMSSSDGIHIADRKASTVRALDLSDADTIVPTEGGAAVMYERRVDLLSFAGCGGDDDCVTASHNVSWISSIDPTPLPGGGVAFNDEGVVEKTSVLEASGRSWAVETNGRGEVAGDETFVYVVSFGSNPNDPTHLLALRRVDGKVAWHTPLPGVAHDASPVQMVLRDGMVAVRIDGKLFAVSVATKT